MIRWCRGIRRRLMVSLFYSVKYGLVKSCSQAVRSFLNQAQTAGERFIGLGHLTAARQVKAFVVSVTVLLAFTPAFGATIKVMQRPSSRASYISVNGKATVYASEATCVYSGASGNMTVKFNGVDLFDSGVNYDLTITYPMTGKGVVYSSKKFRLALSIGDTLSFGQATLVINKAGTQSAVDGLHPVVFKGYNRTELGSNDSGDLISFSGSGFKTFINNGSQDSPVYPHSTDLNLSMTAGANYLLQQHAVFTVDSILPEAPVVTAAANAKSGIDLSWPAVTWATKYRVYRSMNNDRASATLIAEGITGTTYTDSGDLKDSAMYYYWVVCDNRFGGESPYSAVVSAKAVLAPPAASDGFVFEIRGASGRARVNAVQGEMESVLKSKETSMINMAIENGLESRIPAKMAAGINGFAIITTEEYKNRLTKLDDYCAHKTNRGFRMMVITEKDYDPKGETTGGQRRAWKIREWLHKNYLKKKLLYVMFIGNPKPGNGDVPMHKTRGPGYNINTGIPSDYPYADCSGATWDLNGDGIFGDNTKNGPGSGDYGEGGADFVPDVYVGRMMIYGDHHKWASCKDMDFLLQRNIDWENDKGDLSWRQDMLCANVGSVGDNRYSCIRNLASNYVGAKVTWMTGKWGDSVPTTGLTGGKNVVAAQNARPYGILHYHGHGVPTSIVGSINSYDLLKLKQPKVAGFGFAGGCTIAAPTVEDNITWALVRFATIGYCGATETISDLNFQPVNAYVGRIYFGQSNGELFWESFSHYARLPNFFKMGSGNLKMNYYGDPSAVVCPQRRGRPIVLSPNALVEINHQYGSTDKAEEFEFYFKNNTDHTANYTSSTTQPWLKVTPATFTLGANETMTLKIGCDSMGSLPIGINKASFGINSDQGHSVTREVIADHYLPHELFYSDCNNIADLTKAVTEVDSDVGVFNSNAVRTFGKKAKFKQSVVQVRRKNYAISCWMNPKSAKDGVIFSKSEAWSFELRGGKFTFKVYQNLYKGLAKSDWHEIITIQNPVPVTIGQWYHAVLNIDIENHMVSVYIDGVKAGEAVMPHKQLGTGALGGQITLSPEKDMINVVLDDIWILRKYLDQADIDALARGGFTKALKPAFRSRVNSTAQTLSWRPNAQAVSYNVYHGSDPSAVLNATTASAEFSGNTTSVKKAVTATLGNNFWRVDTVTASGVNKGFVWNYKYDPQFFNSAPVWKNVDIADWKVGDTAPIYNLNSWASDTDKNAVLKFELLEGPDSNWLTFGEDGSMGAPFGPKAGDLGTNTFKVRVTDEWGASAEKTFTIEVISQ